MDHLDDAYRVTIQQFLAQFKTITGETNEWLNKYPQAEIDLLTAIQSFLRWRCGHVNKIDERLSLCYKQSEDENHGFELNPNKTGPDLVHTDGKSYIEHKASHVEKNKNYKCNVNIKLPTAYLRVVRTEGPASATATRLLHAYAIDHFGGEHGRFEIDIKYKQEVIDKYLLSAPFMEALLHARSLVLYGKGKSVTGALNFGCVRCTTCKRYHRLCKLEALDSEYQRDPSGSQSLLKDFFKLATPTQCPATTSD